VKKYKKIILSSLIIVAALVIVPFFIPVEVYLKQAEEAASDALGVPVTIEEASISLLPTPRVSGLGVVVGNHADLTIDNVVIIPTLASLFSEQKVIDVKLNKVTMKKSTLAVYGALTKPRKGDAPSAVEVAGVSINQLKLDWAGVKLPLLKLDVALKDNAMVSANVAAVDASIVANVKPEKEGQKITVKLKQFTLPTETPLLVNSGRFDMQLQGDYLDIKQFTLGLYGGTIEGHSTLSWPKAARLKGAFSANALSLEDASRNASADVYMTGDLSGDGKFSAQAGAIGQLMDHLQVQLPFAIKDGVLHGLDLVKVASLMTKQGEGGQTEFDAFTGHLMVAGARYKLSKLHVDSGLLSATGNVAVSAKDDLKGEVDVSLKKSAGLAEVPLVVSGTLDNPSVAPSKLALLGAAAGTAALGPGVGTSLGIKASKGINKLKSLFGGDDEDDE